VSDDKILTRHPRGKSGRSIDRDKYETVKQALMTALRDGDLTHTELMERVAGLLRGKFDANVSWYTETVKLDLEARKLVSRTTSSKPQKYHLKGAP
jgi:hypothetical protein